MKTRTVLIIRNWLLLIAMISGLIGLTMFVTQYKSLEAENLSLENQLQGIQQEQAAFKEGPYTMITNLSSSMYINGINIDISGAVHWTDVNGISGFDIVINGTHYRYVEGHVQMPQLSLYAPYLDLEVIP